MREISRPGAYQNFRDVIAAGPRDGKGNVVRISAVQLTRELERVALFFRRRRIPYMLVGGLALSVWGRPRMTADADFLVLVEQEDFGRLKRLVRQAEFRIDTRWLKWNPMLAGTQLRLRSGALVVDLMRPRDDHDRAAFRRKKQRRLGKAAKAAYYLIAPEDLILQKLKAGRPRDFEDVLTVLERMKGKLAMPYLKRWARRLGVLGELNYVQRV